MTVTTNAPAKLTSQQLQFIDSVVELKPALAVFDCDGTLWAGDSGADFFYWEVEQGLLPKDVTEWALSRYDEYKAGKVGEEQMCGEMVTIHKGIRRDLLMEAAEAFYSSIVERRIFPEMRDLVARLHDAGTDIWAVSSTNDWVVSAGVSRFGISSDHVLAACVHIDGECASDRLIRVPSGPGKATAIREVIGRSVDAAFGNSIHDLAMLEIARHPFVINPNPDLAQIAQERNWTTHLPMQS